VQVRGYAESCPARWHVVLQCRFMAKAFNSWLDPQGLPLAVGHIKREYVETWLLALKDRGDSPWTL
jgi:hypothetical protein